MTTGTAARTTCNKALPRVSNETIPLSSNQGLRILRLSHLYRLIIGIALVVLISSDIDEQVLDLANSSLFRYVSWAYLGCNLLFAPTVEEMYPQGMAGQTLVSVPGVSDGLCGASRPGHFAGVATVVCKLFNMVQPDLAVFGQKDYQQLAVIRTLVHDLNMPIQIIGEPTVRADDGLALSSRNGYLDAHQRSSAPVISRTLCSLAGAIRAGVSDFAQLQAQAKASLEAAGLRPDYVEIRNANDLQPASREDRQLVILAAAFIGSTRLIDNLAFDLDLPA